MGGGFGAGPLLLQELLQQLELMQEGRVIFAHVCIHQCLQGPAKKEPIRAAVPMHQIRYDAKHDIVKCPRGKILRSKRPPKYGRLLYSRAKDCRRCSLASICVSRGRANQVIVIGHDYPALLRTRRRKNRWSAEDKLLYERHRWRSDHITARLKRGTDYPEPSAEAYKTCGFRPS